MYSVSTKGRNISSNFIHQMGELHVFMILKILDKFIDNNKLDKSLPNQVSVDHQIECGKFEKLF